MKEFMSSAFCFAVAGLRWVMPRQRISVGKCVEGAENIPVRVSSVTIIPGATGYCNCTERQRAPLPRWEAP